MVKTHKMAHPPISRPPDNCAGCGKLPIPVPTAPRSVQSSAPVAKPGPAVPGQSSSSIVPSYGIEWLCFFAAAALVYSYVRYIRRLKVPAGVWIAAVAGDALFAAIFPPDNIWTRLAAFSLGAVFIVSEMRAIYHDREDSAERYRGELVKRDNEARKREEEAKQREAEAVFTQNRLQFLLDRMECANLVANLETEMPIREAQAFGISGNQDQQRIISLAGSLMDFAKIRFAAQPSPMPQKDGDVFSADTKAFLVRIGHDYRVEFSDKVKKEREFLSKMGISGHPYEESVYDLPTLPNMFRIANLLSRLALKVTTNG